MAGRRSGITKDKDNNISVQGNLGMEVPQVVQRRLQEDQLKTKNSVTIIMQECAMKLDMQTGQTDQNGTEYKLKLKSFVT